MDSCLAYRHSFVRRSHACVPTCQMRLLGATRRIRDDDLVLRE